MSDFTTTHVVPGDGLPTWSAPDSTTPPGPRLDPTLPVQLVEQRGPWGRVVCSNGWGAWVDASQLVPASTLQPNGPPHVAPAGPPRATQAPGGSPAPAPLWVPSPGASGGGWSGPMTSPQVMARTGGPAPRPAAADGQRVRWVPILGVAAVVVGSFLPWLSSSGLSISAFKSPADFLFDDRTTSTAGFAVGHVLLIVAAIALLGSVVPAAAWLARVGGVLVVAVGVDFVIQTQRLVSAGGAGGSSSVFSVLGAGVYVTVVGGLFVLVTTRGAQRLGPPMQTPPMQPPPTQPR